MFGSSQVKGNIIIKNVILIRVKFVHIQPNDTQLISNWLTSTSELSSVYLRSIQHEGKSSEIRAMFGSSQVKGNIIIKNVILIRVKFVHIQPNDTQLISNWLTSTSELSSVYLRSIQHEDKSSEIDATTGCLHVNRNFFIQYISHSQ